ncbi:hypothetical protein [Kitasatospora sp. NPDC088346]
MTDTTAAAPRHPRGVCHSDARLRCGRFRGEVEQRGAGGDAVLDGNGR